MDATTTETFTRLARAVGAGRGVTLDELGACHALARALHEEESDPDRVEELRQRLGLEDVFNLKEETTA